MQTGTGTSSVESEKPVKVGPSVLQEVGENQQRIIRREMVKKEGRIKFRMNKI